MHEDSGIMLDSQGHLIKINGSQLSGLDPRVSSVHELLEKAAKHPLEVFIGTLKFTIVYRRI